MRIQYWGWGLLALMTLSAQALEITQVRADRLTFDPAKRETATVRFVIDAPAQASLAIYDGRDVLVRRVEAASLAAGEHALTWDGRAENGSRVPPEAYVYTLTARTAQGEEAIHDLTDLTGGQPLRAQDIAWNADARQIQYHLDQPARVNVRLGLRDGGPLLNTLIDWVPRPAGAHVERWDGMDASQVLDLGAHPRLAIVVDAYSLSDNTLLVGASPDAVAFIATPEAAITKRPRTRPGPKRMHYHADQPLESRGDVSVSLALPNGLKKDRQGHWLVSGQVPIRLDVAAEDRERILATRFEPVFFVDGTFAFENEVGFLPTTWVWDTATVNEGEHYVTVNVRGYEGNFGMATLKVRVRHPRDDQKKRATP